jgi:hypothetical protein
MDLSHLIVAMKGDRIAKVECKTCKKIHAYKQAKGITTPEPKEKKAGKRAAAARVTVEDEWNKLAATKRAAAALPYKIQMTFESGAKLAHPQYGEGFVTKLLFPNKIEVLFRDDVRILAHART